MEKNEMIGRTIALRRFRHRTWRARCPESERPRFRVNYKKNPLPMELQELEVAKLKRARLRPIIDPEIRKMALFGKLGPVKLVYIIPTTVRDTSEAACDTEYEADVYKKLANADPREQLFKVKNPATGLPDEVFTACVIKRYREDQCDSSVAVVAASDVVQGTSVLKRHPEEIGESSETMVTASGIADEVLAASVQVLQI